MARLPRLSLNTGIPNWGQDRFWGPTYLYRLFSLLELSHSHTGKAAASEGGLRTILVYGLQNLGIRLQPLTNRVLCGRMIPNDLLLKRNTDSLSRRIILTVSHSP